MSYKALYRKYRSQTFEDLVGQEPIVQTLQNAIKQNKIGHAYLFSGPKGTGKTSVARIFAKALNCDEGIGCQCNVCENCKQITEGSHPDVIEIDAASNSGVEEVRNLIERVKYTPIQGRFKVYIIDEVHMMTNNAFNALLKTLEEPPEYVIFILCTTEPYSLLPTILSRCQRFEFRKIADKDLTSLVKKVLSLENFEASDEAVRLIVELANGGARDALSILDQLIVFSENKIEIKDIETVFGLTSKDEKKNILNLISNKSTLELMNFYEVLKNRKIDISRLNSELLDYLRDALIYKQTSSSTLLNVLNEDDAKYISDLFDSSSILEIIDNFIKCEKELKFATNPFFIFEIFLLKLLEKNVEEKEVKKIIIEEKKVEPLPENKPEPEVIKKEEKPKETQSIDINTIGSIFSETPIKGEPEAPRLESEGEQYNIDSETLIKLMILGSRAAREEITKRWKLLDTFITNPDFAPYAALLRDSTPYLVTQDIIVLGFNYDRQAQKCNIKANQEGLSNMIKEIAKTDLFVYGLNRSLLTELTKKFLDLKQLNKLPTKEEVGEVKIEK